MIAAYKSFKSFGYFIRKITKEFTNKKKNENINLTIYTNKLIEKNTSSLENLI